jgi:hypothetical protein
VTGDIPPPPPSLPSDNVTKKGYLNSVISYKPSGDHHQGAGGEVHQGEGCVHHVGDGVVHLT